MLKFQRNYIAEFEIGERTDEGELIPRQELTITMPFSLQLRVDTGINNVASNTGHFQFINLSEDNKALLWLDIHNFAKKYVFMKLYAGYGQNMPLIFAGFVYQCMSYKDGGSTDFVTEIVCNNNGLMADREYFNVTFSMGTKFEDIIKYVTQDNKYVRAGYLTPDIAPIKRDKTYIGQPLDVLKRENGGYDLFIANGELNVLGDRDVIPGEVQVISDESGLLGSPKRSNAWVECDMVFEPGLRAGQAVALNSSTLPWMNRTYKIIEVKHNGTISPNTCGKLTTTVTMSIFTQDDSYRELKKPVQQSDSKPPKKGIWDKPTFIGKITSFFGLRAKPNEKASKDHKGIDIGVGVGTPVYAAASGRVAYTAIDGGDIHRGYGKFLEINHGNGLSSLYAHLSKWVVAGGQQVTKGQLIAYSGNTGNTTGAHLHFETRRNGKAVNPIDYIGTY